MKRFSDAKKICTFKQQKNMSTKGGGHLLFLNDPWEIHFDWSNPAEIVHFLMVSPVKYTKYMFDPRKIHENIADTR
jgi:hypothetical protein